MKKIIAIALVLVLSLSMATVAFAAVTNEAPGEKIKIDADKFSAKLMAGDPAVEEVVTLVKDSPYFSTDYFRVDSVKYSSGAAFVESVKIDGKQVVVKLKQNYKLEKKDLVNFGISSLSVKVIKDFKADATVGADVKAFPFKRNQVFSIDPVVAGLNEINVGHTIDDITIGSTNSSLNLGNISNFKDGDSVGEFSVSKDDVSLDFRAFKGDKLFININTDADMDLVKANPEAELTFYNFEASASVANGKIFFSVDKDSYIYEMKDGKPVKTNFKWSDDDYAIVGKVSTLGKYVISDVEIKAAPATTDDTKNPNTGANDFVGVAVALAVVSLVAAGAVSLKK